VLKVYKEMTKYLLGVKHVLKMIKKTNVIVIVLNYVWEIKGIHCFKKVAVLFHSVQKFVGGSTYSVSRLN
jgi:O-acetylhomoserine/O-acetylserine sulfhydrylase-like pyridoxal-dependent enzyme